MELPTDFSSLREILMQSDVDLEVKDGYTQTILHIAAQYCSGLSRELKFGIGN